jgi:hypothetical protein
MVLQNLPPRKRGWMRLLVNYFALNSLEQNSAFIIQKFRIIPHPFDSDSDPESCASQPIPSIPTHMQKAHVSATQGFIGVGVGIGNGIDSPGAIVSVAGAHIVRRGGMCAMNIHSISAHMQRTHVCATQRNRRNRPNPPKTVADASADKTTIFLLRLSDTDQRSLWRRGTQPANGDAAGNHELRPEKQSVRKEPWHPGGAGPDPPSG